MVRVLLHEAFARGGRHQTIWIFAVDITYDNVDTLAFLVGPNEIAFYLFFQ